jgi:hypothetical protein
VSGPFITPTSPDGVSAEIVAAMSPQKQQILMQDWFFFHFEDAAKNTPYDPEKGYIYVRGGGSEDPNVGGPYDPRKILEENFRFVAGEDQILLAASRIQERGSDWAPTEHYSRQLHEMWLEDPTGLLDGHRRGGSPPEDDEQTLARAEVSRALRVAQRNLRGN